MQAYQNLDLSVLIEMLQDQTQNYTKMMAGRYKNEEDFEKCKLVIHQLQKEIEFRKGSQENTTISDTNISFTE
ncbi:MAG: hypothetical protein JWM28_2955 [Chitinophagaceae bacterium]|nr:hypothetical protein [Chitinophagaceae bacterium]